MACAGATCSCSARALCRSGADTVFRDLLAADELVYAGYSPGPCVASPSLRGLELVDDADAVMRVCGCAPLWEGLALLAEAFVQHYWSVHPETAAIELVVARHGVEGVAYTLRDGQALIISGPDTVLV
jgi:dipeptidase E